MNADSRRWGRKHLQEQTELTEIPKTGNQELRFLLSPPVKIPLPSAFIGSCHNSRKNSPLCVLCAVSWPIHPLGERDILPADGRRFTQMGIKTRQGRAAALPKL